MLLSAETTLVHTHTTTRRRNLLADTHCDNPLTTPIMAGRTSRQGATPFTWTTVLYIFLVLVFPLACMNVQAQEESTPESYGDGK